MRLPRPNGLPIRIPAWAWKWLKWREHGVVPAPPVPAPAPQPIPMFDSINVANIPLTAPAAAGYVDGKWQTISALKERVPNAKILTIAAFAADNARCLDVEPGDATPAQAAGWIRRQKARGQKNPVIYCNAGSGQALIDSLTRSGLKYGVDYMWWSAHYDPAQGAHFCGPHCGFNLRVTAHATQWTDKANGKSLDESICSPGFFS